MTPKRTLAVLALGAATTLAACTGSSNDGTPSTSPSAVPCRDQSYQRADNLTIAMTRALQKHDRTAFLALATGGAVAPMTAWFDNVNAIGFDSGAAGKIDKDYPSDAYGTVPTTQSLTVRVGLHNPLDEYQGTGSDRTITTPATDYALTSTVVKRGDACTLRITSWKSLNNAPWDAGRLLVVKTARTVVAGDPAAAVNIRRVSRLAETAATFDAGLFANAKHADDIRLKGYVVFVPTSNAQVDRWFNYQGTSRPSGWTKDAGGAAGIEYPLPGVQLAVAVGSNDLTKTSGTGGGRVSVTETGLKESDKDLTATLVHEFTHAIYNNYSLGWFTGRAIDPALAEGAARYIEAFYRLDPNPRAENTHSMDLFKPVLRSKASLLGARSPVASQIYGRADQANFYYDVSASSFSYLAFRYGFPFAVQSIRFAYANGGGPFSGVITDNTGGDLTFGNESTIERAWATWLPKQL